MRFPFRVELVGIGGDVEVELVELLVLSVVWISEILGLLVGFLKILQALGALTVGEYLVRRSAVSGFNPERFRDQCGNT